MPWEAGWSPIPPRIIHNERGTKDGELCHPDKKTPQNAFSWVWTGSPVGGIVWFLLGGLQNVAGEFGCEIVKLS